MMLLLWLLLLLSLTVRAVRKCKPQSPLPANATCGEYGRLRNPHILRLLNHQPLLVPFETCVVLAKNPEYALPGFNERDAFSYEQRTGECLLYERQIKEMKFVSDLSSSVQFWSKNCFQCTFVCPEPGPAEVIMNGHFEWSNVSEYPLDGQSKYLTSPGHESNTAYKCHPTSYPYCSLSYKFDTCTGDNYHFSYDYKVERIQNADHSEINFEIGTNTQKVGPFSPADNGVWTTVTTSFQRHKSVSNLLTGFFGWFTNPDKVKPNITLDNLSAYAMPYPIPVIERAPNLLSNSGFESGVFAPWVPRSNSTNPNVATEVMLASPGHNSGYAIKFRPRRSGEGADPYDDFGFVGQSNVRVRPGRPYVLRYSYTYDGGGMPALTTSPTVTSTMEQFQWYRFFPQHAFDGWFVFEGLFVPHSSPVKVEIGFLEDGRLDDVSVREANV